MDNIPLPRPSRLWKSKADFFRPFRTAASEAADNVPLLYDPSVHRADEDQPDLRELNSCLAALADIFPDVQPEVFREMLLNLSSESRLQVVIDHLLQKKAKWVRGRWITPDAKESAPSGMPEALGGNVSAPAVLQTKDLFRSGSYKKAVKQVLYQEFRALPHSTIKAILAEQNFSYALSRPVLMDVSSRTWRFTFTNFWSRRSPPLSVDGHPFIIWRSENSIAGHATPALKRTGNAELDHEIYELFVAPAIAKLKQAQIQDDRATARELNEVEARDKDALFDCECCYTAVTFEEIAACDQGGHFLCLECIRRTVHEALYGQGWARTADLHKSTVRCFAPTTQPCQGCIPKDLVCRALSPSSEMDETWREFQARVSTDALRQSGLPLQRCPFCDYAEVDEVPRLRLKTPWAIRTEITDRTAPSVQLLILPIAMGLAIFALPLLAMMAIVWLAFRLIPRASLLVHDSWLRVHQKRRGMRFKCQGASCRKVSCMRCMAAWRDPHVCFESEKTSLRTAIEASATAAVKRTCPRCMLSFVKSSGCNKMVCPCGYTMCYYCRQEVTSKEGYAHFCQHFRPTGGRCTECERCDLYGDEDEDAVIRRAAEAAEQTWREKEGVNPGADGERSASLMVDAVVEQFRRARWYDVWLDRIVDAIAT